MIRRNVKVESGGPLYSFSSQAPIAIQRLWIHLGRLSGLNRERRLQPNFLSSTVNANHKQSHRSSSLQHNHHHRSFRSHRRGRERAGDNMVESLGNRMRLSEEAITKAASQAMKAHNSPGRPYLQEKHRGFAIFAFSGFWLLDDWFTHPPFGETAMDASMFPSLRSVGNDEAAAVSASFLRRFKAILSQLPLEKEVPGLNSYAHLHDSKC